MKLLRAMLKVTGKILLLGGIGLCITLIICYVLGPPDISADPITVFYDDEKNVIGETAGQSDQVTLDEMAPAVIDATIVIEDQQFFNHYGFDLPGIARAIWKNIKTMHLKEGASTITQQYARNLYLSHEKTWIRKLKEAFYTIRLEMFYTKEDILSGYLNTIYYGHGAYGIEEASQVFFNKKAEDLSLAEAAMLAGIPKGPTYYSPFNDEEKARNRQKMILQQLLQKKYITQADYHTALAEKLEFTEPYVAVSSFAHYFKDTALEEAARILHEEQAKVIASGYRIYTTLDKSLQTKTETYIDELIPAESDIQIGVMTLHPKNGAIKSLIGGKDYVKSPFNRATDAKRMVGSAFKPFLYYAALEHGYTATTMLLSEPTSFVMADGDVYEPSNFNGYYAYKPISLTKALALSDNIYAVKTNLFLEPENVIKVTRRFGIKSELPNVPSLALGSASISLKEMAEAYGVIANKGKEVDGFTVMKIVNRHGKVIYEREKTHAKQRLDERKAFILAHLMTGMFDRRLNGYMEVTGSSIINQLSHLYAGKSGTTDTDNWMIGFSPQVVTAVWTGYDQDQSIQKMNEKTIAKNVWAKTIEAAHEEKPYQPFAIPNGIVKKIIDPETGLLATKNCPIARAAYFEEGTEPTEQCEVHEHKQHVNKASTPSFWKRLLDIFPLP